MGIKERKAKEKEELKQLILQAALEILEKEGLGSLSIRKIAERIEYAPATIYLYYRDKDELLYELHNLGFNRFMAKLSECLVGKTARERLYIMGQKYLQFGLENPQLYRLMFVEPEPISIENLEKFDGWEQGYQSLNFLRSVLADCIREGSMPDGDLEATTLVIWSAVHGITMLYLSNRMNMMPAEQQVPIMRAAHARFSELIMRPATA